MLKEFLIPIQLLYGSLKLTTYSSSYLTPTLSSPPPFKLLSPVAAPAPLLSARHLFDEIPLSTFLRFLLMGEPVDAFSHGFCDGDDCNNNNNKSLTSEDCPHTVSCTTFNILAPIYKRVNHSGRRESEFRERWLSRNRSILDRLLQLNSSIICLQEFWVGNRDLVGMYEKRLDDAGYQIYTLARTNNRGDGLLTALRRSQFHVLNYRELLFNDIADRVAQVLHVELKHQSSSRNIFKEALIVNTHLIFPHNFRYCFLRLQQVYKILQYIRSYVDKHELPPMPVILCGDWNGSKNGHVYKFLRSQGFVSTYDMVHQYADETDGGQKWISHLNHRGNICGVDFIWLLNPQGYQKPLKESFLEAVLGNVKNLLQKAATLEDCEMTEILKLERSCLTYCEFSQSLSELGISGHPCGGLSDQDVKDLWDCIDTDGDGVADVTHYLRVRNVCSSFQHNGSKLGNVESTDREHNVSTSVALGFTVKKAELFPPEAERGMWPENYSLSDHAHLTVDFCPVKMHFK